MSVVERGRFRCFGNVFERYNSFSGVPYFLWGIDKVGYKYIEHPTESLAVNDVNAFVELHPLTRPKEMKKKKTKDVSEVKVLPNEEKRILRKKAE